jgi:ligand-binding sensor domain-containing protein/serine phosphatase RsbU (regulator of sigma subunit)
VRVRTIIHCLVLCLVSAFPDGIAAARPRKDAKQPDVAPPPGPPRTVNGIIPGPLRFNRLGSDEGLPSLGIFAIAQDRDGFMWFGTRTGLARYDGERMRLFVHDPDKPSSLPNNDVTALAVDAAGKLWVGTAGGLRVYDRSTETFKPATPAAQGAQALAAGEAIGVLHADSKNRLWVGPTKGGVVLVDTRTGAARALGVLRESGLQAVAERADGIVVLGSRGEGVLFFDPQAGRTIARHTAEADSGLRLPSSEVAALFIDRRGRLWIGTAEDGVAIVEGDRVVRYRHRDAEPRSLSDDGVTTIFGGPGGSVWVGTKAGGLNQFDEQTGGFIRHAGDPAELDRLSDAWVTTASASRDGVIWIGTLSAGVNFFDALALELRYYRSGGTAITALAEDAKQPRYLWMGTGAGMERGGLYRLDRETGAYTLRKRLGPETDPVLLDQHWITQLYSDPKGTLWIGTHGSGLLEYRPDGDLLIAHRATEGESGAGDVQAILPDPGGRLWLGTWGEGLARLDPRDDNAEFFPHDPADEVSLSSSYVYTVVRDTRDPKILWVGTAEGGLNRFDTSSGTAVRHVRDDNRSNSISNNNVLSIHQDPTGQLWIGTYGGGLNRFDPKKGAFKRYDRPEHPTTVYGILQDPSGALWLTTEGSGLHVLDPRTDRMIGYSARDGVQADEFAQGGYHRGASGTFYFGGVNGVTALVPERVRPDGFAPPLLLTGFRIFDEPRALGSGEIELSYSDAVVSFQFASPAYADPHRVKYEYQLVGLHDRWIATDQGSVTYTNLDPGDYTFHVRAIGRHGAASSSPLTVPLHVSPPPWRTWWAYALYVLGLVLVALAVLRYQKRKITFIRQQNRLETVENELKLTAAVQTGFLPESNLVRDGSFGLVGVYRPAEQCGGDWWWHERINGYHVIAVGDVTGHGPGPAMVTASVSTTFRVMRQIWQDSGPIEFLRVANDQVVKSGRGEYLMQLTVAQFDPERGKLTFYSAAGFPALCIHEGTVRVVTTPGVPLGTAAFDVSVREVDVAPGDRFMLLSDGIPEIETKNGRRLGLRNVIKVYQESATLPLDRAADRLLGAATQANPPGEQEDDWTFVMAEWDRA